MNAPHLWNDLPDNLRLIDYIVLFKRHLKTRLFKAAFSVYRWVYTFDAVKRFDTL